MFETCSASSPTSSTKADAVLAGVFTDHGYLRGISLGELGTLMEMTIHASMHLRWASPPAGRRPEPGPTQGHTIDAIWDDPRYDFLGDTYSSHVHPVFWSLHGWIDDRIEDWKIANAVWGNEFWKGTWAGPWPGAAPLPTPGPPAAADAPPPAGGEQPAEDPLQAEADTEPVSPPTMNMPAADPAPQPPPAHAMPRHGESGAGAASAPTPPEHQHADPAALEAVVTIIGRCGIFHSGYEAALSRPT